MAPPTGINAGQITSEAHQVAVDLDVSEIVGRLEREAIRLVKQFSQQGLEGEELARAVQNGLRQLSDAPIEKAARGAASEAFNLGRNLAAQERAAEIQRVVRTEVLDLNTCPPCRELDGTEYEVNSQEYFENMPPAGCDGRELCRGFFMFLSEAA